MSIHDAPSTELARRAAEHDQSHYVVAEDRRQACRPLGRPREPSHEHGRDTGTELRTSCVRHRQLCPHQRRDSAAPGSRRRSQAFALRELGRGADPTLSVSPSPSGCSPSVVAGARHRDAPRRWRDWTLGRSRRGWSRSPPRPTAATDQRVITARCQIIPPRRMRSRARPREPQDQAAQLRGPPSLDPLICVDSGCRASVRNVIAALPASEPVSNMSAPSIPRQVARRSDQTPPG